MNTRKDNKLRINGVRVRDIRHPEQSKVAKAARRQAKFNARIEAAKKQYEAEQAAKAPAATVASTHAAIQPPVKVATKKTRKTVTPRLRQSLRGVA